MIVWNIFAMTIMKKLMKILEFVKRTDSGQMKQLNALVRMVFTN